MTTEDRAYEAAARALLAGGSLEQLTPGTRAIMLDLAKRAVDAFLTAMGQEVR